MECVTITNSDTAPVTEEDAKLKCTESAENFQHFIYELFEKNGILNDLRAYLRGHIVEVLKNAQTGAPPTCQKHFTQRLELTNQALNMLVTEYLLRYEFSYSLSVFVSEIPLANMVFGLAKTLMMQSDNGDHSKLWFSDSDVWSILNYLGIKCDSQHATKIIEAYKDKESPLLWCILKCLPFYCRQDKSHEQGNSSMESLTSEKSSESSPEKYKKHQKVHRQDKCKHYAYCKSCQTRLHRVKEKYVKKKKNISKNVNIPPENVENVEKLVKNVSNTEKALVDEMFNQLKNVYETEVEMVKEEEAKKYKQVLATYAVQLQKRQTEMEETFKQRESELEQAVQQKKKFLWGLAQALRDQHQNMAAAMSCVRGESERLTAKEDNIKSQLFEAETVIKNRSEEMRSQISNEILILEGHLDSMKKERHQIDREKFELEKFKSLCDSKIKLVNEDSQYETLKREIVTLKNCLEARKLCVAEKCTMTEFESGGRMNNHEVGMKSDSEERVGRAPNQVVNDLKKQKNVNFDQSHLDAIYQDSRRDRIRSHSTEGFEERDVRRDAILLLQDENERLKHFARQQEQHIDELNMQTARLQAELGAARLRPRTAPALSDTHDCFEPRLNTSFSAYNSLARGLGAGENTVLMARDLARCGVAPAHERRADPTRYLVQQWRTIRRASPPRTQQEAPLPTASAPSASHSVDTEPMRETAHGNDYYTDLTDQNENAVRPAPEAPTEDTKTRCKSPKSMLKEAKLNLRNKVKDAPKNQPNTKREKSPNSVLREAKLRLRKLEIEAEAVEKSYLDFRKRQTMREESRSHCVPEQSSVSNFVLDAQPSPTHDEARRHNIDLTTRKDDNLQKCKKDIEKFLKNYEKKFNAADSHFRAKGVADKAKVIPDQFVELDKENATKKDNKYLETPLVEFRKLYSQKSSPTKLEQTKAKQTIEEMRTKSNERNQIEEKKEAKPKKRESPKEERKELQILKENINKIYNIQESPQSEMAHIGKVKSDESQESEDKNMLRIEVESVTETNNLKLKECEAQNLFLVVQSSAESKNISNSDLDEDVSPQMTVIVSPKVKSPRENTESKSQDQSSNIPVRLEEPEKLARNVLNDIFHTEKGMASPQTQVDSQDMLESTSDRDKADDYIDDFSADVDNYNSRSEYGDTSPVSHLKTSEDENFWDS